MMPGWPVELSDGRVGVRGIKQRDASRWMDVRTANLEWLRPWEATSPVVGGGGAGTFGDMVRRLRREAKAGHTLPLVVTYDGRLVGQLTVGGISWGSLRSGFIGYWISQEVAGRGIMPTAVALTVDHCFFTVGLHRMEVNIRPENAASLRIVEKLGFRDEGLRQKYLHIDGAWRDHRTFALTVDEVAPGGLLARWHSARPVEP